MKKVYLSEYWDRPLSWNDIYNSVEDSAYCYVDYDVSKKLTDFLCRRDRGSMLISGDLGVGKTSMAVYHILKDDHNKLVVTLNSLELDSLYHNDFLSLLNILKQMATNLIRRLESMPKENTATRIQTWYFRVNTHCKSDKAKAYREVEKYNQTLIACIDKLITYLDELSITEVLYIERAKDSHLLENLSELKGDIKAECEVSLGKRLSSLKLGSSLGVKSEFSAKSKSTDKLAKTLIREVTKRKDGRPLDEVTDDFARIIRELEADLDQQLIFFIDELDYYDIFGKEKDILNSLKRIKNLITLSDIQFVFVVGKKTFVKSLDTKSNYTTVFSDRLFLSKPLGDILASYLDEIIDTDIAKAKKKDPSWELYKWSLLSRSDANFFTLIQNIKERANYDETGGLFLEPRITNEKDRVLASLYRAFDHIYKYYLPDIKGHFLANVLYAELFSILKAYIDWTPINSEPKVTFNTHNSDAAKEVMNILTPEQSYLLSQAKRGLVRYLYQICDIPDITPIDSTSQDTFQIKWTQIQENIDFNTTLRGVSGAVTQEETKFRADLNGIMGIIHRHLVLLKVKSNIFGWVELRNLFETYVWRQLPVKASNNMGVYNKILNDTPLHERVEPLERVKEALLDTATVSDFIRETYYKYRNFLIEKHWGKISVDEKEGITLGFSPDNFPVPLAAKVVILSNTLNQVQGISDFELFVNVELSEGAILNVLLGHDSPEKNVFHMMRFDSRGPGNDVRNGILEIKGEKPWKYVTTEPSKPFPSKQQARIKCSLSKGVLTGYFSTSPHSGKYTSLFSYDIGARPILNIGFGNELGPVKLSHIRFVSKKPSH